MRKKFTLLIMSAALLLGSGTAWGQTWGGGYLNPGTDLGKYQPHSTGVPLWGYGGDYNARGANYTSYIANTDMILLDGNTSRPVNINNSCSHSTARNWASSWASSNGVWVHIPINGSTWSNSNYYNQFAYGSITVTGNDSWGGIPLTCIAGSGSATYPANGVIEVAAGADVRLANNIQHPGTIGSDILSSTLQLPAAGTEYSIRFDALYTGTGNNYGTPANKTVTINPSTWTAFTNGQGIGFWTGIPTTGGQGFSVTGGGTGNSRNILTGPSAGEYPGTRLMLGDNTGGQGNIAVNSGPSQAVYIFNYQANHHVNIGFGSTIPMPYTVAAGDLLVRNDNTCQNLIFAPQFKPTISGNGNIYINDYNDDTNAMIAVWPNIPRSINQPYQRGTTTFNAGADFTFAGTGELVIEGADVTFASTVATIPAYNYNSTASGNKKHLIAARGSVSPCFNAGNIAFTAGAVTVTKTSSNRTVWVAKNDITTSLTSPVTYTLDGATQTDWSAGHNIDVQSKVDFISATTASGYIRWYAMNDIRTNFGCNVTDKGYVKYDIQGNSSADVLWSAINSIHTKGRVDFGFAGGTTGTLTLKADTGNITAERIWAIDVNNDANEILISAQSSPQGLTNRLLGRITTYDSVRITRGNTGAGQTEILSQNDIRTAMVDVENKAASANTYLIESHSGDIWFGHNDTTSNPTGRFGATCLNPVANEISYDLNNFTFTAPGTSTGWLHVYSGFGDLDATKIPWGGGNIHFTHINETLGNTSTHPTEFKIPFSNWYYCGTSPYDTNADYEQAGIIGGVGRCAIINKMPISAVNTLCTDTGLIYRGFNGELLFDAGTRGNIIINNGSYLTFQGGTGNSEFRTRWGDVDMRYPFDVDSMKGSLLYLASSDLADKLKTGKCGCAEKRNNVYLQDFKYIPIANSGSVFIGADNNIKLQYGGLKGSAWNANQRDPFFSDDAGYPCGKKYHCDSDTSVNQARDLILNFAKDQGGIGAPITTGGFAAVASDLIDVYTNILYNGGQGAGMSNVPKYGSLHGESVAGFGLYIKTQANKNNWDHSAFDLAVNACWPPKCDDPCLNSILQNTARVTFHSDARIDAENQRVYIGSPVLETYGNLDLNTHDNKGGKTSITIQTDSLIVHDSLIIDGKLTNFTTWSNLYRNMPIVKLGHQRFTPPFTEDGKVCAPCFIHEKTTGKYSKRTALDTLYVTYRNGASMPRLHTLVADHTVLSFLTDSFDHRSGDPTLNAKFYTDTFKVRNHVELYTDQRHERDGHFELISEKQMSSKDYAGIYARHLHMEPIAPTCAADFPYSQLWLPDPALDVITTSTFGGYGWIHADVHVEIEATLAPGYASLRSNGDYCHELKAGTLKMQDLRLDKGAELRYSIGDAVGFNGEKVDCIEVDEITMYGSVFINVEKRCKQKFEEGCYPIIRYNSVAVDTVNLNNLKLKTMKIDGYRLSLDTSIPGVVYLCIGETSLPQITRAIQIPQTAGVTTNPAWGTSYIASQDNFTFKAKYTTAQPLKVVTDRLVDGKEEELTGRLNANGEYEYVIRKVIQNIVLKFGPDYATDNISIDGRAIWSHNNTIYMRVETDDIASIYSVAGQLVERMELPAGSSSIPMERGVYIVTLKDGSVHKVIVK